MQGSQVLNSYTLVWWQAKSVASSSLRSSVGGTNIPTHSTLNRSNGFYQMLYAVLGISQAVWMFLMYVSLGILRRVSKPRFRGYFMDIMATYVSNNLHHEAMENIFHAPMSFFDTTV